MSEELTAKLDAQSRFGFERLYAHDLAGRAHAFQRLIAGGMDIESAVNLSGIATQDG